MQRMSAIASENAWLLRPLGPGRHCSHEEDSLSLFSHALTGLSVESNLERASFITAPLNSSLCCTTDLLVLPSTDPSPTPSIGTARCPSSSWPRYAEHSLASPCRISQHLENSSPVLQPDWSSCCHLLSCCPDQSPRTYLSAGHMPPSPVKWGSACSNPPMKAAGDVSTLLLRPKPPILIGCLNTQC